MIFFLYKKLSLLHVSCVTFLSFKLGHVINKICHLTMYSIILFMHCELTTEDSFTLRKLNFLVI